LMIAFTSNLPDLYEPPANASTVGRPTLIHINRRR